MCVWGVGGGGCFCPMNNKQSQRHESNSNQCIAHSRIQYNLNVLYYKIHQNQFTSTPSCMHTTIKQIYLDSFIITILDFSEFGMLMFTRSTNRNRIFIGNNTKAIINEDQWSNQVVCEVRTVSSSTGNKNGARQAWCTCSGSGKKYITVSDPIIKVALLSSRGICYIMLIFSGLHQIKYIKLYNYTDLYKWVKH